MEQNQSLFSLSIDPITKEHLGEAAKWGRFLAIVGMVLLVILILAGVYLSTVLPGQMSQQSEGLGYRTNPLPGFGIGMAIGYLLMAMIFFFPLMYLLRFANKTRNALVANDQQMINSAFQNLKICFRYVGIVVIILLVLYALLFVIAISTAATNF